MNTYMNNYRGLSHLFLLCALVLGIAGCSNGDDGAPGAPGPGVAPLDSATELSITVTGVSINSAPVVNFRATNQDDVAVAGLTLTDLRFTIAKLTPGSNGAPSSWQNYINTSSASLAPGYVRGNRENNGTLVDNKDGTYTYTFSTDITNPAQTCPPADTPCVDADGNPINTSYNASLTHRVAIQTRGAVPQANGVYTFIPGSGAVTSSREIVKTETCNVCHNKIEAHDARIETQYCVMCHNPGSTANGTVGAETGPTPIDFKVMIHKIHRGEGLPSVEAGGDYGIFGFSGSLLSFGDVVFPQDIRNCTKCHDGTDGASNFTAQGDNWKTQPSKAACGSCHDDVYFGASPVKPYQTVSHITVSTDGGAAAPADPTDDMCITCHGAGEVADVVVAHSLPALLKAEAAKYKLNIVSVTNTTPTSLPTITFSITDPTNGDAAYDIAATPAITGGSLSLLIAWNTTDINNNGRSNAQPITINLLSGGALSGSVTDNGDGTYSVTSATAIPADATGSGRAGFYGRMSVDVDGDVTADRIQVKSVVSDFTITGGAPVARRSVVDIAKCNQCHDQLSLHGGSRTDEPQLCIACHNPNATDTARRPVGAPTGTLDNKAEEAIDFKRLIHGIHAAAQTTYTGDPAHGFREQGLVVYGFGGSVHDFSHVRFPGILNDCSTCHTTSSYQLSGIWEEPTLNGILATTIDHGASLTDQSDDLNITPVAAVCSSCHDGDLSRQHMLLNGANFADTQDNITANVNSYETCAVCHGPGRTADVKVMHGVP